MRAEGPCAAGDRHCTQAIISLVSLLRSASKGFSSASAGRSGLRRLRLADACDAPMVGYRLPMPSGHGLARSRSLRTPVARSPFVRMRRSRSSGPSVRGRHEAGCRNTRRLEDYPGRRGMPRAGPATVHSSFSSVTPTCLLDPGPEPRRRPVGSASRAEARISAASHPDSRAASAPALHSHGSGALLQAGVESGAGAAAATAASGTRRARGIAKRSRDIGSVLH